MHSSRSASIARAQRPEKPRTCSWLASHWDRCTVSRRRSRTCLTSSRVGPQAWVEFARSSTPWVNSYCAFCERMEARGGTVLLGKTDSLMGFRGTCDSYLFGPTRNPFNLAKNSGGSSGGSAAAVVDGLLPAEGTDGATEAMVCCGRGTSMSTRAGSMTKSCFSRRRSISKT